MRRTSLAFVICLSLGFAVWGSAATVAKPARPVAGSANRTAGHRTADRRAASRRCPSGAVTRTTPARTRRGWILLGQRRIRASVGRGRAGRARAFAFSAGLSGKVSSIHVYVDARSRATRLMVALYANSGCRPGSRITDGSQTIARGRHGHSRKGHRRAAGWRVVRVRGAHIASGRTYWLVVLGKGGVLRFRDRSSRRCSSLSSKRGRMRSLSTAWRSGTTVGSCAISAYAAGSRRHPATSSPGPGGTKGTVGSPGPGNTPSPPGSPPVPPPSRFANLWVSTSGGSCVRQGTPGAEVAAHDCGSLNAAYHAASCGDTINIDAGHYPDQPLNDKSALDNCAQNVVIEGAAGLSRSQVVIGNDNGNSIDAGDVGFGASNWTLQNLTVASNIAVQECKYGETPCSPFTHNITINDIQGGSLFVWAPNMTIENSDFGPCYNLVSLPAGAKNNNSVSGPTFSPNPSIMCNENIKGFGQNTLFKNNVVHDFLDDDSDPASDHFECMFIGQDTDVTLDGNEFYDCQIYSIFIQNAGPGPMTIENNEFWAGQGGMGGCAADRQCPAENSGGIAHDTVTFADNNPASASSGDILLRYNSFDPCCGIAQEGSSLGSNVRVEGNILGGPAAGGCISGVAFSYNLWLGGGDGGPCGTGDVATASNPFVSSGKSGATADDLHLRCGTQAQNLVKSNASDYQLNFDIGGNARNPSGPRDAGAAAESSCGT
jgi:hypothetical protein